MVFVEPEAGVGDQEVAHLAPAEVEHVRAPVGVLAAQRVGILVQRGAVEASEREIVLREVSGHPVHDDADAGTVELVHQVLEVVRIAESGVHGVVAGHLISPRARERVLGQRHELDMREAFLGHVVHELVRQLAVVADALLPAAGMDLVDADRAGVRVGVPAVVHPCLVVPFVVRFDDDGAGRRRNLVGAFHRVGLHLPLVVRVEQLVLVDLARLDAGDEDLPDARGTELAHGVAAAVPGVEVADHADRVRVGRPDGERGAHDLVAGSTVGAAHRVVVAANARAQGLPQAFVAAFPEQVGVHVADGGQVTVRVVLHDGLAALVGGAYTVVGHGPAVRGLFGRDDGHEDAVEFVPGLGRSLLGVYGDALGQWPEHSDGDGSGVVSGTEVTAQHFVRVVERCIAHRAQITLIHWHGSDIFIDVRVSSHNTEGNTFGALLRDFGEPCPECSHRPGCMA